MTHPPIACQIFLTRLVNIKVHWPHLIILTQENRNLSKILWEQYKILVLNPPPYLPELNPIELVFQLLGQCLCHSNARYLSYQMQSEDFILLKCVEVLESITGEDIKKKL